MHKHPIFYVLLCAISCFTKSSAQFQYPQIKPIPVTEVFNQRTVTDRYRNIENSEDLLVKKWFDEQSKFAKSILDTIPYVDYYKSKILQMKGKTEEFATKLSVADSGMLFYMKRAHKDRVYRLYMRSEDLANEKMIFDPSKYGDGLGHRYTINYLQPSWDGSLVLLSLSRNGDFASELVVLDVNSATLLPEKVKNAAPNYFGGVNWLPDNSGYTYLHFPVVDSQQEGYKKNSFSALYILGSDPLRVKKIFGTGIDPNFYPITKIKSSSQKYIVGFEANSDNFWNSYYADIETLKDGNPQWKPLLGKNEKMFLFEGAFLNDKFYYLSAKHASNYQLNVIDLSRKGLTSAITLVPYIEDEVMTEMVVAKESIYLTTLKFGVEARLYKYRIAEGTSQQMAVPFSPGSIELYAASPKSSKLYLKIEGWSTDVTWLQMKDDNVFEPVEIAKRPEYPGLKDVSVREILVPSFDGVKVPLSLIHSKNIKKDGSNRVIINSYGAYGSNMDVSFSPTLLTWVQDGGILAVPHIRGGGEKGEDWHREGMKEKKPNSWKDLIAVTEYLISEGYTSKEKTILYASSAGAVSSSMAIIERPELFQVFVSRVPMLNPFRYEAGSYKQTSYIEFGSIDKEDEIDGLLALDPYHNLKKGLKYPATMIIPSEKDDRIDLWESGKFVAKMQEYNTSNKPIILDINKNGTHYSSSTDIMARLLAFAKWQTE